MRLWQLECFTTGEMFLFFDREKAEDMATSMIVEDEKHPLVTEVSTIDNLDDYFYKMDARVKNQRQLITELEEDIETLQEDKRVHHNN